jgi:predicted ATP-grasp superfamily ATP-dependent carboligase
MPVVILGCGLGALAILRSLGTLSVPLFVVGDDPRSPAMRSRYCLTKYLQTFDENEPADYLRYLKGIGDAIGRRAILIPTSDRLAVFAVEHKEALQEHFIFPANDPELSRTLMSKQTMYTLALEHKVPTAETRFPQSLDDVREFAERMTLPIMLKAIHGDLLERRTGKKMVIVSSQEELISQYIELEDPALPNLMMQELIPGDDDQVYIFNGYFDENSDCLAAFTGRKIRQCPIHTGAASLGECRWYEEVASLTQRFMKEIGYKGILDIGYRLDPRDGQYKVLDINPRVGQAFRLFVADNGLDVIRALYLDLTGQAIPRSTPIDGRRWVIEDYDLASSFRYYQEGSLKLGDWLSSFSKVQEGAYFSLRDPLPFSTMVLQRMRQLLLERVLRVSLQGSAPGERAS